MGAVAGEVMTMGSDGACAHGLMVVGGHPVEAITGERYAIANPANGRTVGTAPLGGPADAARAIAAAEAALPAWRQLSVHARADAIERGLDAVSACAPDLAVLLTREQGKPLHEAAAELAVFLARMRSFVRLARPRPDGGLPALPRARASGGGTTVTRSGVTVGLVAWNFPAGLLPKKIGPALLAGGTVVVKPSLSTPLATTRIVELMNQAGLPPGVLNCVTGRGDVLGAALVAAPGVSRVHLTGSDQTGTLVKQASLAGGPELLLQLGGSDPMIVCPDADLPKAIEAACTGRYWNAGQVCTAVKRLYVASEVYDAFVRELSALVRLRQPGDGLVGADAPCVRMGPLHTAAQRDQVEEQLDDAVRNGAEVLAGGCRPGDPSLRAGSFLEATLVANVPATSRLVTEEVFGPVLPVFRTRSLQDAIEQANRSPWDLSASIWTSNLELAHREGRRIRCRRLWINRLGFGPESAPQPPSK